MNTLGLIILGFLGSASIDAECVSSLRSMYFNAEDEPSREEFYEATREVDESSVACLGYRALATACYADTFYNPFKKWEYFAEGRDELEALIQAYPDDAELRFMRYSLQANVPGVTNYSSNLDEDFNLIVMEIEKQSQDAPFWFRAVDVMLKSKNTPEEHVFILKQLKAKT